MATNLEEIRVQLLLEIEKLKGEIELLLWLERKEPAKIHCSGHAESLDLYRLEK